VDSAESVTEAEPSMIEDVIRVENASVPAADAERAAAGPEAASKVVEVDLGGGSGRSQKADVPIGARKSGQG